MKSSLRQAVQIQLEPTLLNSFNIVDYGETSSSIVKSDIIHFYQQWLDSSFSGGIEYLKRQREIKKDVKVFFPEFQKAIVFLFSYKKVALQLENFFKSSESNKLKIASFVLFHQGIDYHIVVKKRLQKIAESIIAQGYQGKILPIVDSSPVLEKDLALKAQLGFIGRNSLLIHPEHGSFFIIGSLLFNHNFDLDISSKRIIEKKIFLNKETASGCRGCNLCVEACPAQAIEQLNGKSCINASKCISAITIENVFRENIDLKNDKWVLGCDRCQLVCPYNNIKEMYIDNLVTKSLTDVDIMENFPSNQEALLIKNILTRDPNELVDSLNRISCRDFKKIYKNTSLERVPRSSLINSILAASRT